MPHVTPSDRAVADQLAAEVAAAAGTPRTWRRVTALLEQFGVYRLTVPVRDRIGAAFEAAGLVAEPAMGEVERYGTVRLTLRDRPPAAGAAGDALTITVWPPGEAPRAYDAAAPAGGSDVIPIDVDVTRAPGEKELFAALAPLCGGELTQEMVADLLQHDELPTAVTYGDRVRNVTGFSVAAKESERDADDPSASKAGSLEFHLVEVLAGGGWLISCRHARGTPDGAAAALAQRWARGDGRTAGDLGVLLLQELAETYTHARRMLYAWHEQWELDFDARRHRTERDTLVELRAEVKAFRRHLEALHEAGTSKHHRPAWFYGVTSDEETERVEEEIDRALTNVHALGDVLRTSTDLYATETFAHQSRQSERFQELAGYAGALLLVPSLVVGFYGANTALPGEGTWWGFAAMVAGIVCSVLIALGLIGVWRRRG